MKTIDYLYVAIIVVCLILSALFSAADMAYSSVSTSRLIKESREGHKAASRALSLAEGYDKTITTIIFGNDFVNILASSANALLFSTYSKEVSLNS